MEKWIKYFPFMPEEKDTGKLVLAILFYLIAPPIAAGAVGFVLGLTVILLPLSFVVGLAASAYTILGIVFAVMKYLGREIK